MHPGIGNLVAAGWACINSRPDPVVSWSSRAERFGQFPQEPGHVPACGVGFHLEVREHAFDDLRFVGSLPEAGEHERAGLVQGEERLLAEIQQHRRAVAHLREAVIFVPELFGKLGGVHGG